MLTGFFGTLGLYDDVTDAMSRDADRLLAQVGLSHVADQSYFTMSSGERVRSLIARALAARPRLLLLDEPTRGIDLVAKQQVFQLMWELARRGMGCLFVSSELEELLEVCHRILILKDGALTGEVDPVKITPDELALRCMAA